MLRKGTRKYVGKTGSRGPVRLRASGLAAGRNAHAAPWAHDTYAPPCGAAKSVVGTGRTDRHYPRPMASSRPRCSCLT